MITFIDEILQEAEVKEKEERIQMSRLRADQLLQAIAVLEKQGDDLMTLCDAEVKLIEEYRQVEFAKLSKKESWLAWNLEQFMRSSDEKTLNLPHGSLKIRLGRDKIEITDMQKFIPVAERYGLMKEIPRINVPDLEKIKAHMRSGGLLPQGVAITPAQTRFSYQTKGNSNGESAKTGSGVE